MIFRTVCFYAVYGFLLFAAVFAPSCAPALLHAQAKPPVIAAFLTDVYAISAYGDVAQMNPMYWATADSASSLCRRIDATPRQMDTTPQTGQALSRWYVSRVPKNLLPPAGSRANSQTIPLLLDLPKERMWAAVFASGCVINAGYLLDYYRRNPESQFPGLADKQVKQIIQGECSMGMAPRTYPSIFADGKERAR